MESYKSESSLLQVMGIAFVPSCVMMITSILAYRRLVNKNENATGLDLESCLQALSAGMILSAVSAELFPMLGSASFLGVSIGVVLGCLMIYILALSDNWLASSDDDLEDAVRSGVIPTISADVSSRPLEKEDIEMTTLSQSILDKHNHGYQSLVNSDSNEGYGGGMSDASSIDGSTISEEERNWEPLQTIVLARRERSLSLAQTHSNDNHEYNYQYHSSSGGDNGNITHDKVDSSYFDIDLEDVFDDPREALRLREMHSCIHDMYQKIQDLSSMRTINNQPLSLYAADELADQLDEHIHKLEYYVHHFRRKFIEGSLNGNQYNASSDKHNNTKNNSFLHDSSNTTGNSGARTPTGLPEPSPSLLNRRKARGLMRNVSDLMECSENVLLAFHGPDDTHNLYTTTPVDEKEDINIASKRKKTTSDLEVGNSGINTTAAPISAQQRLIALNIIMDNLQIMDSRLHGIHSTVDSATLRFKRRKAGLSHIILPRSGSPVPLTLVIPVFVD